MLFLFFPGSLPPFSLPPSLLLFLPSLRLSSLRKNDIAPPPPDETPPPLPPSAASATSVSNTPSPISPRSAALSKDRSTIVSSPATKPPQPAQVLSLLSAFSFSFSSFLLFSPPLSSSFLLILSISSSSLFSATISSFSSFCPSECSDSYGALCLSGWWGRQIAHSNLCSANA